MKMPKSWYVYLETHQDTIDPSVVMIDFELTEIDKHD